ncbi:MAG: hypothetical protein IPN76_19075 [Saprospiraceae bacterium]|jgi:hypothetical protein|nr:hypothetical protein [Saprospiraceae bacterium]
MKKQSILLVISLVTFFGASALTAQNYKSAIGARVGYPWAVSFKTFVAGNNAIELYGGYRGFARYGWFSANGAYQVHFDLEGVDGLQWYVGAGAGLQFYRYDNDLLDAGDNLGVSIQGYVGLDYKVEDIPLSITLDWVPNIFINGYVNGFRGLYGNLGVRYVFAE